MNPSKLLIAIACALAGVSAHATLLTADFRNESDLLPVGGALVYQRLGRSVGAGDELAPGALLQNPAFYTGGTVFVDFNPASSLLTLKSRDTGDFDTFDAFVSRAVFSTAGERFSGLSFVGGELAEGAAPALSFTGDSLHIRYAAASGFTFTGGSAVFRVASEIVPLPPVPEPETWALMLGGMGLLTARLRRRKAPPKA
ncbi:PEP-CTERM sorting domain-containing protein [Xylophilus sp. Kf1]|nr:PEP-CTERM sorting domain-containing protein [Xylophilus sp. Kf1]